MKNTIKSTYYFNWRQSNGSLRLKQIIIFVLVTLSLIIFENVAAQQEGASFPEPMMCGTDSLNKVVVQSTYEIMRLYESNSIDTSPPEVVNTSPPDGAIDVPLSIYGITVTFSEAVDYSTALGSNVYYTDETGNILGFANYYYFSGNTVRITFTHLLEPGTTYYVHVTTGVTDVAGNHLAGEFIGRFTTIGTPISQLTVTYPNGGEVLTKGQDCTITWNSANVSGNVQIDLYKGGIDPVNFVVQLAAIAPNTGSYPFNPPDYLEDGADYLIGISAEGGTVWDFSDSPFTIETAPNQRPIIDSFEAYPTSGGAPLTVNFTCTAHDDDGWIESYIINYGDGSAPETNDIGIFSKTYEHIGTYQVTCSVVDNQDAATISEALSVAVIPGYAIIVAGQDTWSLWPPKPKQKFAIDHAANNAYRALRNLGFDDSHIFYLNSESPQDVDGDGENEVDAPALLNHFEDAINQIKYKLGTDPTPIIIYLVGHGNSDPICHFIFDADDPYEGYLWGDDLQAMLDEFPIGTPIFNVMGSCYSGCFITSDKSISALNRIIITASHDDENRKSLLGLGGWYHSSDRIWGNINMGLNVRDSYLTNPWPGEITHLWLDDNGDSIGHPPDDLGDDGTLAYDTIIGVPGSDNLELSPWYSVWLHSPGELRVYNSQNRVTGLVNGEIKEEISDSIYDELDKIVAVFSYDDYLYEVAGTEDGTYGLEISSFNGSETITFIASGIYTKLGVLHQYVVDWEALSQGEKGVTLQIDSNGDGTFEQTLTVDQDLTQGELLIEQISDILLFLDECVAQGTLNGRGRWPWMANLRLQIMKKLLESASWFIDQHRTRAARCALKNAYIHCDSHLKPPDFVIGEATDDLAVMILYLMESL